MEQSHDALIAMAKAIGSPHHLAISYNETANNLILIGELDRAEAMANCALRVLGDDVDNSLHALAKRHLAMIAWKREAYDAS